MLTNGKEHIAALHHNNTHSKITRTQARGQWPRYNTHARSAPGRYSTIQKKEQQIDMWYLVACTPAVSVFIKWNHTDPKDILCCSDPYLCPLPVCADDWSSDVSPPGGSECAPRCWLLEGEGQAQLKTQKVRGIGRPEWMQKEDKGRWNRAKQNKTNINKWWGDYGEATSLHNTSIKQNMSSNTRAKHYIEKYSVICSISSVVTLPWRTSAYQYLHGSVLLKATDFSNQLSIF